ncbi:hypothetical protein QBC43DRAFT_203315 [Cladorrhinum sp. PSN259]|nr:hypothetical protein QBC43DRAFT_203315 [Cladorrhinum sp. PSN259]
MRDINGEVEGNTGLQGARASAAQRGRDNDRESRRHHPYRNSQQQHQQDHRGNMEGNHRAPRGLQSAFDDELVEMTVAPARAASHRRTPVPNRDVIIDLTGEPSSPERDPPAAAPNSLLPSRRPPTTNRNPRRQTSFLRRTPSLARSDGSLLGNGSRTVPIDLTMDDDEPAPAPAPRFPPQPREPPRTEPNVNPDLGRLFRNNFLGINIQSHLSHMPRLAQALGNLVNRPMADVDIDLIGGGVPVANPLAHNVPDLRYAFGIQIPPPRARDPPQPKHVPPPPAPEGFTRNTGGDQVIVCAGCDEELQYCPEDEDAANAANAAKHKSPAAKRAKSRKDMEEHFFWALKDCGHVYCKSCYEKRLVKKAERTPFRPAVDNNKKMICSVDDCKTEVGNKYAWVGLFL